jgi:uncharacterized protein (TIGR02246 family)
LVLAVAVMITLAGPALAQSKEAIQKLNDEWAAAFNKGDADTVAALYTTDAYVLPPGAPMVKGRADIQKFWAGAMQHHGEINLTTLDGKPLGPDAAREIGTATFRTKGANPQDEALKYAVVWQREDGQWKLLQTSGINDPAYSQSADNAGKRDARRVDVDGLWKKPMDIVGRRRHQPTPRLSQSSSMNVLRRLGSAPFGRPGGPASRD